MMILVDQMLVVNLETMLPYVHVHQVMVVIRLTNDVDVKSNLVQRALVVPMPSVIQTDEQRFASAHEDIQEIHILTVVWTLALLDPAQKTRFVRIQEMQQCANAHRPIQEILTSTAGLIHALTQHVDKTQTVNQVGSGHYVGVLEDLQETQAADLVVMPTLAR